MQICFFTIASFFWTYTIYFIVKAVKSNVTNKLCDLTLSIFGAIGLFILGLLMYAVAIQSKKETQNYQTPTYPTYYNRSYYYDD